MLVKDTVTTTFDNPEHYNRWVKNKYSSDYEFISVQFLPGITVYADPRVCLCYHRKPDIKAYSVMDKDIEVEVPKHLLN